MASRSSTVFISSNTSSCSFVSCWICMVKLDCLCGSFAFLFMDLIELISLLNSWILLLILPNFVSTAFKCLFIFTGPCGFLLGVFLFDERNNGLKSSNCAISKSEEDNDALLSFSLFICDRG
eukprot:4769_1